MLINQGRYQPKSLSTRSYRDTIVGVRPQDACRRHHSMYLRHRQDLADVMANSAQNAVVSLPEKAKRPRRTVAV